jgi:hypothetical protein
MGTTFRLDARLEPQLHRHAADTRSTIGTVVRDALIEHLAADPAHADMPCAHDLGLDLFGRCGGTIDMARRPKRTVADVLAAKHRGRR